MTILTVGSGKQFSTIAAAVTAAHNGDTIQVQAGTYVNDYATINKNLTLQGVGGMVKMVSTGLIPNGKGIFVINTNATAYDVTINNFEFSGAKVADHNGAGIRHQGGDLVLNDCYFHDNEDGLLSGNLGTLTINKSEFAYNGYGDGQTHNLYVGKIASLTIDDSSFHDAKVGHEIKSRALNTTITNSRIYDGPTGTASYSIDLPCGGNALIQNNVIEQGPLSQNPHIIIYGEEGNLNPGTNFVISGNTILNDKPGSVYGMRNYTAATAKITNNAFFGLTSNQIAFGPNVQTGNQFLITEPPLDTTHPWSQSALPPAVSIVLVSDTGSSSTDEITSNPAVKGVGTANTLVTIKEGGATLGTTMADGKGTWGFTPSGLADGAHTLTASQTDSAGNTGTATLSLMLDRISPALTIALVSDTGSSPTDKITSNPAVRGVGQANTAVVIREGGATLGTAAADGTGSWSFTPSGLADGAHTLTASQTDLAGNTGSATLSLTLDRNAPTVSIALVSDTGGSLTDKLTSDPAVKGVGQANTAVTINEGGVILGTEMADGTGTWSFAPSGLADGSHTLSASQINLAGDTTTATLSFFLDTLPPPVSMVLVSDTGSSSADKITSDPAVRGLGQRFKPVTITEGSATLGTTTADTTGAWSFTPTGLADGVHTFAASQTDIAGNTGTATLNFTLDTTMPFGVA